MPSKVAAQLYTVRDFTKTRQGLAESLKKISRMGYEAAQFSAVGALESANPEITVQEARQMLDDVGIRCIATHRSWEDLAQNTQAEIDFHGVLDCNYVAIGGIPQPYRSQGEQGYRDFVEAARPVIQKLKAGGLTFGYHNHSHEFERIAPGPKTLIDIFIEEGGPDFTLEFDVYWVAHAGANPARLLAQASGRVPVIHAKDKEVDADEGPVMCPVGEGNLDWDGIIEAGDKAGVEWYAVEQDTCRRDAFDCLRSSLEFLTSKGV